MTDAGSIGERIRQLRTGRLFDALAGLLPEFIATARAAVRETGSTTAYEALSDAYGIAASMLVHLNQVDLGYVAMERAVAAAEHAGDGLRRSAFSGWLSWVLMHHTESMDDARVLAIREADASEPRMKDAAPEQISVWGALLCRAATVAARRLAINIASRHSSGTLCGTSRPRR
jgi:hypothetical protein